MQATRTENLSTLRKGITTKKEVRAFLGQPHDVRKQVGGSRWTYYMVKTSMNGMAFIPVASLFAPGMNVSTTISHVEFDSNGKYIKSDSMNSWDRQNAFAALGRAADSFKNDQQEARVRAEMNQLGVAFDQKEATKAKDMGTVLGANPES
ncbi:MAG: outer membrane protein assembly factor BamE [Akkermansiaceae bacterium]|nr:outer membrane protein assembly factor BamE [Akkermansiaceae bacterium]